MFCKNQVTLLLYQLVAVHENRVTIQLVGTFNFTWSVESHSPVLAYVFDGAGSTMLK